MIRYKYQVERARNILADANPNGDINYPLTNPTFRQRSDMANLISR